MSLLTVLILSLKKFFVLLKIKFQKNRSLERKLVNCKKNNILKSFMDKIVKILIKTLSLLGLWLRSKCSICSHQFNI